jgi:bifunctional ADP-heptose synthase (sugar kinase/adenylyltransferase)
MPKILLIGDSCRDVHVYGDCKRLCPEAPVPVLNPTKRTTNGGMAANVYDNLLALGVEVVLVTNDNWEEMRKVRFVDARSGNMLLRMDENDRAYPIRGQQWDLIDELIDGVDAVVISDYDKGFLSELDILKIGTRHKTVFLDTKKVLTGRLVSRTSWVKINEHEYDRIPELVRPAVDKKTIVTLGSGGARYGGVIYPVEPKDVKDVSGAGDTFMAALVAEYIQHNDIEKAITFANRCASSVVQKSGVSVVDPKEFLRENARI